MTYTRLEIIAFLMLLAFVFIAIATGHIAGWY